MAMRKREGIHGLEVTTGEWLKGREKHVSRDRWSKTHHFGSPSLPAHLWRQGRRQRRRKKDQSSEREEERLSKGRWHRNRDLWIAR
jgi:hypothetical protein